MPSISVIIPFHNASDTLGDVLDSLASCTIKDIEIICVDDNSTDDSPSMVTSFGAKLLKPEEGSGLAALSNAGAAVASAPILLFLDDRAVVDPDMIAEILKVFRVDEETVAAVGVFDSKPINPGFWSVYRAARNYYFRECFNGDYITWFHNAMGAVRTDTFNKVGGFSSKREWKGIENIEFSHRLARIGRIRLARKAVVKHHFKGSLWGNLKDHFIMGYRYVGLYARDKRFDNYLSTTFQAIAVLSGAAVAVFLIVWLLLSVSWEPGAGLFKGLTIFFGVNYLIMTFPFAVFTWRKYSLKLSVLSFGADFVMSQFLGLGVFIGLVVMAVNFISIRLKKHLPGKKDLSRFLRIGKSG